METEFKKRRMTKTTKADEASIDGALTTDNNESATSLTPNKTDSCAPALPQTRDSNISDIPSVQSAMANKKTPSVTSNGRSSLKSKSLSRVSNLSKGKKASLPRNPEINTEVDDEGSIAGSIQSSGSIRRTEAERILYFKNQPECGELEPHRVFCTRCNSFVNLGRSQTYTVRPWELHRVKCDARAGDSSFNASKKDETEAADTESTATPSVGGRTRRTVAERKAYLEADTRVEEIQHDQVKCRGCQIWIRLSNKRPYELYHWQRHQEHCKATTPSNRVAAAERKLRLVNDAQSKAFDIRSVECSQCNNKIVLEGDGDYNLTKWDEHKAECPGQLGPAVMETAEVSDPLKETDTIDLVNSVPFPKDDMDVHPGEQSPSSLEPYTNKNLKRARSPSVAPVDNEVDRATNRPRRESLVASSTDLPSVLDWMILPLKSFVRGFRESLRGDTQPRV